MITSTAFFAIVILLIIGVICMLRILRRYQATVKTSLDRQAEAITQAETAIQLTEKGIQLNEATNKLLKEILEVLKNKN
jgi:hypothetical protein